MGVGDALDLGPRQLVFHQRHHGVQRLRVIGEPTPGHCRASHRPSRAGIHRHTDRDETALAEDEPVGKRRLADIAHRKAVDVDVPDLDPARPARLAVNQVHHDAVLRDHHVLRRDTGPHGQFTVRPQVLPLAVHRHDVAGPDRVV
jgi:hypothetical protein